MSVGDTVAMVPPDASTQSIGYRIAGAVHLPGWHWPKLTGMRPRTHRAAALIFADYDSVAKDFHLPIATHVWLDYESDRVDPEAIQTAVGNLGSGDLDAKVIPVQTMRDHLQRIAHREIWLISQVLSIALGISCFAVLNVLMASVHSRRWEFGGLHAIGFTGSELVRSVLAEGIMIALAASLLGLGFGISFAWCGCELAQSFSFFGGLHLPLVVPWLTVAGSILLMITLVLLAAAWPAITIGSKRPLARFHRSADAL